MARRRRARRLLAGVADAHGFGEPRDPDAHGRGNERPDGVPAGIGRTDRTGSSVGGTDPVSDARSDGESQRPAGSDAPADASTDTASDRDA